MIKPSLEKLIYVNNFYSLFRKEIPRIGGIGEQPKFDTVMIDYFNFGIAGSGYKLLTRHLINCMALVFYNPRIKVGFLSHISEHIYADRNPSTLLAEGLDHALKNILVSYHPDDFQGTIVGVSYFSDPELRRKDSSKEERKLNMGYVKQMLKILKKTGFSVFDPNGMNLVAVLDRERELLLDNSNGLVSITGTKNGQTVQEVTLDLVSGKIL